ncbi:acetyl-CoA synthetase-like protein [Desarmillaria tabescens]|uniref:Acetyl-CoA synthetase-like protein n=1 Tax=Armillaria tabescens TaxID=1929756 RepID=A0AA39MKA8_ARMTA|nr:acetyl-CoA synthetase-like protein [Desarmillaria tabescens]KAK0437447.1 acetyl-CoA synthetase-like protein [Desarmillaria tabescens]
MAPLPILVPESWVSADTANCSIDMDPKLVCIHQHFERIAHLHPEYIALDWKGEKSLKAGCAFVPLDPEHLICLTQASLAQEASHRLSNDDVIVLSVDIFLDSLPPSFTWKLLHIEVAGSDMCYVLFMSGSTGTPKGVKITHSAAISSVIDGPESNQALRWEGLALHTLGFSNYVFDFSIWDVYITLTCGGCLCLAPKLDMLNDLGGVCSSMSVTFLETMPTVLSLLDPKDAPTLCVVNSGGEPLTKAIVDKFKNGLPNEWKICLGNLYGPTECTTGSIFCVVEAEADPSIIGHPFGGNRVYLLDDEMKPCFIGDVGTIWLGGTQVSLGYLGQDDLMAKSFRTDPFITSPDSASGNRMYNTGDLGMWTEEGSIRCLGWADSQVKIHGQRIETGEIESVLMSYPLVKGASIIKRAHSRVEELVAFLDTSGSIPFTDITARLKLQLPIYMIPTSFILLDGLPITTSGKVDHHTLERLSLAEDQVLSPSENKNLVEIALSDLNPDNVPLDVDFFKYGGDSITTIHVSGCDLQLLVHDFPKAGTVCSQAALIVTWDRCHEEPKAYEPFEMLDKGYQNTVIQELSSLGISKDGIEDAFPSLASVSGLVSLAASNPQSYLALYKFQRQEPFNPRKLKESWKMVFQRHAIFRTLFIIPPNPYGEVTQITSRDAAIDTYTRNWCNVGFSLGKVPTRISLFESPESSVVLWQVHHSQYDGWSYPIILDDLWKAYGAVSGSFSSWDPPATSYAEFVWWVKGQDSQSALEFWRSELKDASLLPWPRIALHDGARSVITTDGLLTDKWKRGSDLLRFCHESHVTVSSFVRAALAFVLGLHGHTDDVLFGVVTSGRAGGFDGVEDVVGACIATLPSRIRVSPNQSAVSFVRSVHLHSMRTTPYENVGLADVIKSSCLGDLRDIFQVLLTVQNLPHLCEDPQSFLGRSLTGHRMELNYALAVTAYVDRSSNLDVEFEYDSRVLTSGDVSWFQHHLSSTFDAILDAPDEILHSRDIVTQHERSFVLASGVGLAPDPTLAEQRFVHLMIDQAASSFPSTIAIEHTSGTVITYADLTRLANQAAHGLRLRGVHAETMVPVLFDKYRDQTEIVICILAILKSGGAFVPLDASWPPDRLVACIRQTQSEFLLYDSSIMSDTIDSIPVYALTIGQLVMGHEDKTKAPGTPELRSDSLIYVVFTSGTTGEPKGIMITHANVIGYVANGSTIYPIHDIDRVLHFSPFSFDQGIGDIWMALTKGYTLLLADMDDMVNDMSAVLNSTKAQYTVLTPPVATLIGDQEHPCLKALLVGGDRLPGQLVERWRGKVAFLDDYGPSEVTTSCIAMPFAAGTSTQAGVIGRPFGSTRAYIVDPEMNIVPIGACGELCLSGNQVARGYLNLPERTNAAFMDDPFNPGLRLYKSGDITRWTSDGYIEYIGRHDDGGFIKLRGLRIDVSEIEETLMSVRGTVAVVELLRFHDQDHLVAFIGTKLAPAGTAQITISSDLASLRDWVSKLVVACKTTMPAYALPTLWVAVDAIPQANTNKCDRKQLRRFFQEHANRVQEITRTLLQCELPRPPRDGLEQSIALKWSSVLGRNASSFSAHDDFFSLGGNSISAVRFLWMLRREGWDITIREFYARATTAGLASLIEEKKTQSIDFPSRVEPASSTTSQGLVFTVQETDNRTAATSLWLLHDGGGLGREYINLQPLERGVFAIGNPSSTRAELISRYASWDAYVDAYDPLIPKENVYIGGWSFGGMLALAIAERRLQRGDPVKGIVLIDSYNTQGWRNVSNCSPDDTPDILDFSTIHQAHVDDRLIESFVEPRCDVPVLLVRAGNGLGTDGDGFVLPEGQKCGERNFWSEDAFKSLDIVTIFGAGHYDLMQSDETVGLVSETIRRWFGNGPV